MKITESKLREMIRGVIREFVTTATGTGGASLAKGRQSQTTKDAKRSLDKKKSTHKMKKTDASSKASKVDNSKKYRKAVGKGSYTYSSTLNKGFSLNPAWTAQDIASRNAKTAELSAKSAEDAAQITFDSAEEDDLRKSTPTQKPPTSGGSYGKGKKKKN
tara:strand:+ start:569 stop:1048 length:480 start_codon:yes stop_codon:yes gene_type:complete